MNAFFEQTAAEYIKVTAFGGNFCCCMALFRFPKVAIKLHNMSFDCIELKVHFNPLGKIL